MVTKPKKNLFNRQKLLVALLQIFGGSLSKSDFQKYLFLFTHDYQGEEKAYNFVPYTYGCFSFQSYADLRRLIELEIITGNKQWRIATDENYLEQISPKDRENLTTFHNQYQSLHGKDLVKHVYSEHPYYAIKSEIAEEMMSKSEFERITELKPRDEQNAFFTIGYEGICLDTYLDRLIRHNVKALCDVRKNPISRKYGFSKFTLEKNLRKIGIDYIHFPSLGIESEKRQNMKTEDDYNRLFDAYEKSTLKENKEFLNQLENTLVKYKRVAITCFEKSHAMCHRGRIAKAMSKRREWKYEIKHI